MTAFALAIVFYALVPLLGAWRIRRTWSRFREAARRAAEAEEVDFSVLQTDQLSTKPWRLTGTLEAFEGHDRLWIGNGQVSAAVSLRGVGVYFLDTQPDPFAIGVEPPRRAEASNLGALPEGTQFLVSGWLSRDERGLVQFASRPDHTLLVLAFEGPPDTVLARAVYAGRPALDQWNSWTPLSLGLGFVLLLTLAYAELRPGGDREAGLVALAFALLPSTFFLPPGILFFYGFARLWSRARDLRARADLARARGQPSPLGSSIWGCELASQGSLLLGVVLNLALLSSLLRLLAP